jgi:hypothetical protein
LDAELGWTSVQLSDGEIAELNQAATRSHQQANQLRARLGSLPPPAGTGQFLAQTIDRQTQAQADPPDEQLVAAARSGMRGRGSGCWSATPRWWSPRRAARVDRLEFAEREQQVLAARFGLDGSQSERSGPPRTSTPTSRRRPATCTASWTH